MASFSEAALSLAWRGDISPRDDDWNAEGSLFDDTHNDFAPTSALFATKQLSHNPFFGMTRESALSRRRMSAQDASIYRSASSRVFSSTAPVDAPQLGITDNDELRRFSEAVALTVHQMVGINAGSELSEFYSTDCSYGYRIILERLRHGLLMLGGGPSYQVDLMSMLVKNDPVFRNLAMEKGRRPVKPQKNAAPRDMPPPEAMTENDILNMGIARIRTEVHRHQEAHPDSTAMIAMGITRTRPPRVLKKRGEYGANSPPVVWLHSKSITSTATPREMIERVLSVMVSIDRKKTDAMVPSQTLMCAKEITSEMLIIYAPTHVVESVESTVECAPRQWSATYSRLYYFVTTQALPTLVKENLVEQIGNEYRRLVRVKKNCRKRTRENEDKIQQTHEYFESMVIQARKTEERAKKNEEQIAHAREMAIRAAPDDHPINDCFFEDVGFLAQCEVIFTNSAIDYVQRLNMVIDILVPNIAVLSKTHGIRVVNAYIEHASNFEYAYLAQNWLQMDDDEHWKRAVALCRATEAKKIIETRIAFVYNYLPISSARRAARIVNQ